jgi:3'(2'), 5'-bisphosphate nucleotidase
MPHDHELQLALRAARRAAGRILELYAPFVAIPDAPASITTDADREAQEIILQDLYGAFPADAFCAEEKTPTLDRCARPSSFSPTQGTGSGRVWVIDPIDGTRGFAQKTGQFSVMIALVDRGGPAVGVVLEPALDRLTWAVRGAGCWRQDGGGEPLPCRVSETTALAAATLVQSRSRPGSASPQAEALAPARVVETHSAGVKLARVARAEADLYVNTYPNFHDWDVCAGHVLVQEAGGRVTGLHSQEIVYGSPAAAQRVGLLASNGRLHEDALARLRLVF